MNISDLFKAKPDKPIDALIKELLENNGPPLTYETTPSESKTDTDVLVDSILGKD